MAHRSEARTARDSTLAVRGVLVPAIILTIVLASAWSARAQGGESSARAIVHLLDYIAQDYGGAVAGGRIVNPGEFAEMREFSQTASRLVTELPRDAQAPRIEAELRLLATLVEKRADASEVARQAVLIKNKIIQRTGLQVAPRAWPDIERGAKLFQQGCAACHGATGRGDGPSATKMNPPPSNFHHPGRMMDLSPFQAFNTIRLGVPGTAMPSFALRDDDTWAIAFHVVSLRYASRSPSRPGDVSVPLAVAASQSDRQIQQSLTGSAEDRQSSLASTRLHSAAAARGDTLSTAAVLLSEAEAFYRRGDYRAARNKALAAYLDGVEPAEARIKSVSPGMVMELERAMTGVRRAIEQRHAAATVATAVSNAKATIGQAERVLQGSPSAPWVVFSLAVAIVLREGFEAVLIIVAILSVLRAVGAGHAARWVHAGWIAALGLGILAWFLSGRLIVASGLNRELMAAVTSLIAVVVLLYMGFWLHRRTQIAKWRAFIEDQVNSAMGSRKQFGLTVIAFFAVFREALETVLFLIALSLEGGPAGRGFMASGVVVSLALTILLAWALISFSARLPLGTIFSVTSILMMALAVVLVGKGVHALQESGVSSVTSVPSELRFDLFGFHPTLETLLAQTLIAILSAILWFSARSPQART